MAIAMSYSWVCIFFKKPYIEHGYSDVKAWIQRRQGVDTATTRCGYSDGKAWIQRWLGMDIETARRGYSDGLDI